MSAAYLYAAAFEGGIVKVGRSTRPRKRIGEHEDRLSCAGIRLLDRYVVECQGDATLAEAFVIDRCAGIADGVRQREWFYGLQFSTACALIDEACAMQFDEAAEDSPIKAILAIVEACGSQVAVAKQAGYTKATISAIVRGRRGITPSMALVLEQVGHANGVAVTCEKLCPSFDWLAASRAPSPSVVRLVIGHTALSRAPNR